MDAIGKELVRLIAPSDHTATDLRVVVVRSGDLSAHRSFEEVIGARLGASRPSYPINVVIERRGLIPGSFLALSAIMRPPSWLAGKVAEATGMGLTEHYLLWPSENARYAFDAHSPRVDIRWARRAGAIGRPQRGGLAAVLLRSPLYTEVIYRTGALSIGLEPLGGKHTPEARGGGTDV